MSDRVPHGYTNVTRIVDDRGRCWCVIPNGCYIEVAPGWAHGDFGLQNLRIDPDSLAVTAIVDWELAGPGDPGTRMWRDRIAVTRASRPGTTQA